MGEVGVGDGDEGCCSAEEQSEAIEERGHSLVCLVREREQDVKLAT